ncbi:MAG: hypothetical protein ACLP01_28025, partial [Solirubrobacteraceae bacterium]
MRWMAGEQLLKTLLQLLTGVVEIDARRRGVRGPGRAGRVAGGVAGDGVDGSGERAAGDLCHACQQRWRARSWGQRWLLAPRAAGHVGILDGDLDRVALDHIVVVVAVAMLLGVAVAELQRVQKEPPDLVWHPGLPGAGVVDQLPAAAQQMRKACLMTSVGSGRVGERRLGCAARAGPTGLVSSRRHLEPCMRFSRTRLSDV